LTRGPQRNCKGQLAGAQALAPWEEEPEEEVWEEEWAQLWDE